MSSGVKGLITAAKTAFESGDYEEACVQARSALKLKADCVPAALLLAGAALKLGRRPMALKFFTHASELLPGAPPAWKGLVDVFMPPGADDAMYGLGGSGGGGGGGTVPSADALAAAPYDGARAAHALEKLMAAQATKDPTPNLKRLLMQTTRRARALTAAALAAAAAAADSEASLAVSSSAGKALPSVAAAAKAAAKGDEHVRPSSLSVCMVVEVVLTRAFFLSFFLFSNSLAHAHARWTSNRCARSRRRRRRRRRRMQTQRRWIARRWRARRRLPQRGTRW